MSDPLDKYVPRGDSYALAVSHIRHGYEYALHYQVCSNAGRMAVPHSHYIEMANELKAYREYLDSL